jgi:hypothetical protein
MSHCLAARAGLRGHDTVQRLTVYVEALSRTGRGANVFPENVQGSDEKAWELLRRRLAKTAPPLTSCASRCWERLLDTEITWCRTLWNHADGVASIHVYCRGYVMLRVGFGYNDIIIIQKFKASTYASPMIFHSSVSELLQNVQYLS